MAYSSTKHTGDGSRKVFPFTFTGEGKGYIRDSDVKVYVNGAEVNNFSLVTDNTIEFSVAPANGSEVNIRRVMPKGAPYATFERASNFSKVPVNNSFLQQLYTQHEILDGYNDSPYATDIDMGYNKIINLKDGTDPYDAVNYKQTVAIVDEAERQAQYSKSSADSAKASEVEALRLSLEALDSAQRAESASNTAGMQIGSIVWFLEDVDNPPIRSGLLKPDGKAYSRTTYKDLYEYAESNGLVIENGQWETQGRHACYSNGVTGQNNFRVPDFRGYFIRVPDSGAGRDTQTGRLFGYPQQDCNKAHNHTATAVSSTSIGTYGGASYSRVTGLATNGYGTYPTAVVVPASGISDTILSGYGTGGNNVGLRVTNTQSTIASHNHTATTSTSVTVASSGDTEVRVKNIQLQPYIVAVITKSVSVQDIVSETINALNPVGTAVYLPSGSSPTEVGHHGEWINTEAEGSEVDTLDSYKVHKWIRIK